ncbi:MAG: AAA family ATPase [Rhizobacter sp.]|nr:AAA family ATPase [Rhizobacter sp.]
MYIEFFGLKQEPFSIAPDPRYLFMSERHREALAHLLYGLGGGGGFVLLTGEIGAGKTTVCRCFLEQIPENCNVAYIFNPKLTAIELVRSVCDEFGVAYARREPGLATVTDYLDPLNAFLLKAHAAGQNNVLIIDEAQNLSADVLEQLRLMTNLETRERKLLQIILIGQPELRGMLAQPGLQQLAQRVIARFHLEALSESETAQYIRHRLSVAGRSGPLPFADDTLRRIHRLCAGVPRRINLLCDRALLGAYASGQAVVDRRIVHKAAREVFDAAESRSAGPTVPRRQMLLAALLAGLVGMVAAYAGARLWFDRSVPLQPPASAPSASSAASAPAAASAPSSAASAPSSALPASAPASAVPFDVNSSFSLLTRREGEAWRELASLWHVDAGPGAGDPCPGMQAQQLPCYRTTTTLAVIRQLDRPGILTLRDPRDQPAYALLTGIGADAATLTAGDVVMTVPLTVLANSWRGEFATFWRAPPTYRAPIQLGSSGPVVEALASRLAALSGEGAPVGLQEFDAGLHARVSAFQRAQGLQSDGIVGPTTFMQLNRASGVDEPRLLGDATGR